MLLKDLVSIYSDDSIVLSWEEDQVSSEGILLIDRKVNDEEWRRIAEVPSGVWEYTDNHVTVGGKYQYRVCIEDQVQVTELLVDESKFGTTLIGTNDGIEIYRYDPSDNSQVLTKSNKLKIGYVLGLISCGEYVYAFVRGKGLVTISIKDIQSPEIISADSSFIAEGKSRKNAIHLRGKFIYSVVDGKLVIYEICTHDGLSVPQFIGMCNIDKDIGCEKIYFKGGYLYLVCMNEKEYSYRDLQRELYVVNVANPVEPKNVWKSEFVGKIAFDMGKIYIGDTKNLELRIMGISNDEFIEFGTYKIQDRYFRYEEGYEIENKFVSFLIDSKRAYLVTRNSVIILDISDSNRPFEIGKYGYGYSPDGYSRIGLPEISKSDNWLYIYDEVWEFMEIVNVDDFEHIVDYEIDISGYKVFDVYYHKDYLFLLAYKVISGPSFEISLYGDNTVPYDNPTILIYRMTESITDSEAPEKWEFVKKVDLRTAGRLSSTNTITEVVHDRYWKLKNNDTLLFVDFDGIINSQNAFKEFRADGVVSDIKVVGPNLIFLTNNSKLLIADTIVPDSRDSFEELLLDISISSKNFADCMGSLYLFIYDPEVKNHLLAFSIANGKLIHEWGKEIRTLSEYSYDWITSYPGEPYLLVLEGYYGERHSLSILNLNGRIIDGLSYDETFYFIQSVAVDDVNNRIFVGVLDGNAKFRIDTYRIMPETLKEMEKEVEKMEKELEDIEAQFQSNYDEISSEESDEEPSKAFENIKEEMKKRKEVLKKYNFENLSSIKKSKSYMLYKSLNPNDIDLHKILPEKIVNLVKSDKHKFIKKLFKKLDSTYTYIADFYYDKERQELLFSNYKNGLIILKVKEDDSLEEIGRVVGWRNWKEVPEKILNDLGNNENRILEFVVENSYGITSAVRNGDYIYAIDNDFDILVIDAEDSKSPKVVSKLNTASNPIRIILYGNYAYVSCSEDVYILDISNPPNPKLVRTYQMKDMVCYIDL